MQAHCSIRLSHPGKPHSSPSTPGKNVDSHGDEYPTGTVTLVFTDVEGSIELWDKVEAHMGTALKMHNQILRELMIRYNGYEVKTRVWH